MNTQASTILNWLHGQQDSMLRMLEDLVRCESPSSDRQSQDQALAHLMTWLHPLDLHTFRSPGRQTGGWMMARPRLRTRGQPVQLMLGHIDTVWPAGTLANRPIHRTRDEWHGPGAFDMKAGLVQMVFALQAIRHHGWALPALPVLLVNADEEIGSRESTPAIRRLARIASRAFVLEPPLGPQGRLKTARKGIGRFTLVIRGKAAHAGLDPELGTSAIVELSTQIQKLFAMNDPQKGITVNVGMIEGGVSPNVIAPESKAIVDVRVLHQEDGEQVTRQILGLQASQPGIVLEISGGIGRPPMERTTRNQALWQIARQAGRDLGLDLEESTAGGGSDGNTTSQYTATLDGMGTTGDGAHADHEHILIHSLPERTALLTMMLLHPLEPENPAR
ncbi:MAG: M20 family metallopeptidase [Lewinellaceae bacterium]|nr:M20 family metallopeptidase [Saprospiraceae bacterium]MCB9313136.1 M20 family metallopeptidase [Lewinellaceae bacterium]